MSNRPLYLVPYYQIEELLQSLHAAGMTAEDVEQLRSEPAVVKKWVRELHSHMRSLPGAHNRPKRRAPRNSHVRSLELGVFITNTLLRSGIETLGDLEMVFQTNPELAGFVRVGPKSRDTILDAMENAGYYFRK